MSAYKELKSIDLDGQTDIDYLVYLGGIARSLKAEFTHRNLETPTWLDNKDRDLTREINSKTIAEKTRKYNELLAQEASLMTPAEKRDLVKKKIESMQRELGIASTPAAPGQ